MLEQLVHCFLEAPEGIYDIGHLEPLSFVRNNERTFCKKGLALGAHFSMLECFVNYFLKAFMGILDCSRLGGSLSITRGFADQK